MAASTAYDVTADDVRKWLGAYPWFLVLDGLDEVPASGNRDLLLSKVQEFWIDVSEADGDVLVLATTRPQGYSDDFSPRHYQHLWLTPLSPKRAVHYAERFTSARFGNDTDRKSKVMRRLQRAAGHDATARIMQSPLQITIMAILVDQGGEPPQERWRLFRQYYDVIYRREVERRIAAAAVLQEYQSDIDAIHSSVGLLLQIESERTGNADAKLPATRFRAVVEERLRNEGHSQTTLNELTENIIYAASQRLVFLVGLESGVVGFEIRSLQEFMAAEGLMAGCDEDVANRLSAISALASWRNVFLFATGRCFADRQYMRDVICNIAATLNDAPDDMMARTGLAGSLLAADILEDGAARQQPKYHRQLTRLALRALDLTLSDVLKRLAKLYDESVRDIYYDEISMRVAHSDLRRRHGAWGALVPMATAGVTWANDLIEEFWPKDKTEQVDVFNTAVATGVPTSVANHIGEVAAFAGIWRLLRTSQHSLAESWPSNAERLLRTLRALEENRHHAGTITVSEPRDLMTFELSSVKDSGRTLRSMEIISSIATEWKSAEAIVQFLRTPDAKGLSEALFTLSEAPERETTYPFFLVTPWPLAAFENHSHQPDELRRMAHLAAAGRLGTASDWLEAEQRWLNAGITAEDILYMEDDLHWPYDANIATLGFAFQATTPRFQRYAESKLRNLADQSFFVAQLKRSRLKRELSDAITWWAQAVMPEGMHHIMRMIDTDRDWFMESASVRTALVDFLQRTRSDRIDEWWSAALNKIGSSISSLRFVHDVAGELAMRIADAFLRDNSLRGLLHLLSLYAQAGTAHPKLQHLDVSQFEGIDREAATIIRASLVSTSDIEAVERWSLALISASTFVSRLLETLAASRPRRESTGKLALAIAEAVFDKLDINDLTHLHAVVTESLQSRRSNLDQRLVWERLRLPTGLHAVLQ